MTTVQTSSQAYLAPYIPALRKARIRSAHPTPFLKWGPYGAIGKLPTRKQLDYAITIAQAVNSSVDEVKKMDRRQIEAFIDKYGTKMRLKDAFCGEHFYRNVDRGHDIGIDFHDLT